MPSGILPIHKPSGISSFDVIRNLKRSIGKVWKDLKIGHGGTLDPLASGVLTILVGEATKAFDFLLASDKTYHAVIQLGSDTDTDDSDGKIIKTYDKKADEAVIRSLLPRFSGMISQVPPRYSALKIDGKRSYDLARNNIEMEIKPRTVEVKEIKLLSFNPDRQELHISVRCSSGTYIRSIARDIGKEAGCGGHIKGLIRTKACGISIEGCHLIDSITPDNWIQLLIETNKSLEFLPFLSLKQDASFIFQGRKLPDSLFSETPFTAPIYRILKDNKLLALVERKDNQFRYLRVFNE